MLEQGGAGALASENSQHMESQPHAFPPLILSGKFKDCHHHQELLQKLQVSCYQNICFLILKCYSSCLKNLLCNFMLQTCTLYRKLPHIYKDTKLVKFCQSLTFCESEPCSKQSAQIPSPFLLTLQILSFSFAFPILGLSCSPRPVLPIRSLGVCSVSPCYVPAGTALGAEGRAGAARTPRPAWLAALTDSSARGSPWPPSISGSGDLCHLCPGWLLAQVCLFPGCRRKPVSLVLCFLQLLWGPTYN